MAHLQYDKKMINRVKRIQGQLSAVEKSLLNPEKSSCIEVLQQVAAVKGAVNGLLNQLIEQHLKQHILKDVAAVDDAEAQQFIALLQRYL